jgi:hypothetical protein
VLDGSELHRYQRIHLYQSIRSFIHSVQLMGTRLSHRPVREFHWHPFSRCSPFSYKLADNERHQVSSPFKIFPLLHGSAHGQRLIRVTTQVRHMRILFGRLHIYSVAICLTMRPRTVGLSQTRERSIFSGRFATPPNHWWRSLKEKPVLHRGLL